MPRYISTYRAIVRGEHVRWNDGADRGAAVVVTYNFGERGHLQSSFYPARRVGLLPVPWTLG